MSCLGSIVARFGEIWPRVGRIGVLRIAITVGFAGGGVDHLARSAEPLHSAFESPAGRVRHRGILQHGVRRVEGEVEEERLGRLGRALVHNPFLGLRGEQVGGVAAVE